jgi:hypothetical protein
MLLFNNEKSGYSKVMKRMTFVGLIVTSLILSGTTASAATKPELVLKGFQSYVANAKSTLSSNKTKYEASVTAINATYSNSVTSVKSTFDREILAAKNLYEPQIETSKQTIKDAQAKLLTVNQVKVLKLGTFRGYWGNLDCPTNRPQCVSLDDKGNLFQVGEVTKLKSIMGERADYLYEIQLMIDLGLIEMLNSAEYQKSALLIRFEPDKIKTLTTQWDAANVAASTKQSAALEVARLAASGPLMSLMESYDFNKESLENQIAAGNLAIRAAKRAGKNPSIFDKAFVVAYKFDYNAKGLDDVANLSFSSLNTLRSFLSQFAIIELADKAAGVNASYSYLAAEKINKSVGNVFTSDEEFQIPAKLVASQYRKITKVSLKF